MSQIIEWTPESLRLTQSPDSLQNFLEELDIKPSFIPAFNSNAFYIVDEGEEYRNTNQSIDAPIGHSAFGKLPSHHDSVYYANSLIFWKPSTMGKNVLDEISLYTAYNTLCNEFPGNHSGENIHIIPATAEILENLIKSGQISPYELSTVTNKIILPGEYFIRRKYYNDYPSIKRSRDTYGSLEQKQFVFDETHEQVNTVAASLKNRIQNGWEFPEGHFKTYHTKDDYYGVVKAYNYNRIQTIMEASGIYLFLKVDSLQRFYGKF